MKKLVLFLFRQVILFFVFSPLFKAAGNQKSTYNREYNNSSLSSSDLIAKLDSEIFISDIKEVWTSIMTQNLSHECSISHGAKALNFHETEKEINNNSNHANYLDFEFNLENGFSSSLYAEEASYLEQLLDQTDKQIDNLLQQENEDLSAAKNVFENEIQSIALELNSLRLNLHDEIMSRLNSLKIMDLKSASHQYRIVNWPDFVSFNLNDWDERDLNEIRFALPSITFTKLLPNRDRFSENSKIIGLLRNKLSESYKRIQWSKYHLKGWPVGVLDFSRFRIFKRSEMLAIRRGIEKIRFVPILKDEERTITYTNGEVVISPLIKRPKKRKLHNILNENYTVNNEINYDSTDGYYYSSLDTEEASFLLVQDQHLDQSFEIEIETEVNSLLQRESETLSLTDDLIKDCGSFYYTSNDLYVPPDIFDDIFDRTYESRIESDSEVVTDISETDTGNTLDLNALRVSLYAEVMARANVFKKKMNLNNIICNYKINNWPDFVSFDLNYWDERDLNDIRLALPNLIFTKYSARENRQKYSDRLRVDENSKITALLLGKLKSQNIGISESCKHIQWTKYHLKGWPVGVSDHSNSFKFTRPEMLAISRGIDKIRFVPISEGEKRTITYTNGKVVIASVKSRPRKRKLNHNENTNDDVDIEDDEFHYNSN